jgi:hypothetical protein
MMMIGSLFVSMFKRRIRFTVKHISMRLDSFRDVIVAVVMICKSGVGGGGLLEAALLVVELTRHAFDEMQRLFSLVTHQADR